MTDLLFVAKWDGGVHIFTATTQHEQREIAKYIKEKYPDYRIIDCSKREETMLLNPVNDIEENKILVINFQDLFLAPYGDTDEETTVTNEDKIHFFSRTNDPTLKNELRLLGGINFMRDSFYLNWGKRNCIIGMTPMMNCRLYSPLYIPAWIDLETFIMATIKFNEDNNFIKSSSKYTDYFNNMDKGENDYSGEKIYSGDIIFAYNGKIVRVPNYKQYYSYGSFDENKKEILMEALENAPELVFKSKQKTK